MATDRTELETVLRTLFYGASGCRSDNWHDMGMPEISFEQAMAIELAPLLEHFADSMVEVKDLKVFDDLYGFSVGDVTDGVWFEETIRDMPTAHATLCAASYADIYEALLALWEENRRADTRRAVNTTSMLETPIASKGRSNHGNL